jgi:hypothetical protein
MGRNCGEHETCITKSLKRHIANPNPNPVAVANVPRCSSQQNIVNNQIVPLLYPNPVVDSNKLSTKILDSNKPEEWLGMW